MRFWIHCRELKDALLHLQECVREVPEAAMLAESVGGYLASITSEAENGFVFSLVNDEKYFWRFPGNYTPDSHYKIMIGPFLGGAKTDGSSHSKAGWVWLSG